MKLFIVYIILFSSSAVFAGDPATVGDFIRGPDGSILSLTHAEAKNLCLELGSRLATPREYAGYLISKGSRGLRETKFPDLLADAPELIEERKTNCRQGFCYYHLEKHEDGKAYMDFYFAPYGYRKPVPGFKDSRFWTSSPHAGNRDYDDLFVTFDSAQGWFGLDLQDRKHPARCAAL